MAYPYFGGDSFDDVVDLDGGFVIAAAEEPTADHTGSSTETGAWPVTSGPHALVVPGPPGWPGRVELNVMTRGQMTPVEQSIFREASLSPATAHVLDSSGRVQVRTLSGAVLADVATPTGQVGIVYGLAAPEDWQPKGIDAELWVHIWSAEEPVRDGSDVPPENDQDDVEEDDEELSEEEQAISDAFVEEVHARRLAEAEARRTVEPEPEPSFAELGLDPDQTARATQVLAQLDEIAAAHGFADVGHPYSYAVDARLHAYADAGRWALVVETLGYNPRGSNLFDEVHVYGNCLTAGVPGIRDEDFRHRVDNMDDVEDADEPETYAGDVAVRVRGRDLSVDAEPGADLVDVFRSLVPEHRDLLLAEEDELRVRIPGDLAEVLRLEEWHQPDLLETEPGQSEAYRLLAAVLATADPAYYQPTEGPNTHWENWPESGGL